MAVKDLAKDQQNAQSRSSSRRAVLLLSARQVTQEASCYTNSQIASGSKNTAAGHVYNRGHCYLQKDGCPAESLFKAGRYTAAVLLFSTWNSAFTKKAYRKLF